MTASAFPGGAAALLAACFLWAGAAQADADAAAGQALLATHCAACHGPQGRGTANGPDLRARVRTMSEPAFSAAVLQRYRWTVPATVGAGEGAAREALLRGVLARRPDRADMPAWQDEPAVASGIGDLYAYLRADRD